MKYESTQPMTADLDFPAPQGALPVWIKVFTKPGERTFLEITDHPEAKAKSAYIWVFLAGTLSALISSLVQFVGTLIGLQQVAPDFGQIEGLPEVMGTAGRCLRCTGCRPFLGHCVCDRSGDHPCHGKILWRAGIV